ncbi:MAG: hypothetical protein JWR34_2109 [Mycobacterium sp.]|nr:hypothetical protein [Mycobacterium sp.]
MLGTPLTGVRRVHPDHRDPTTMRHRCQSGAELTGGDPSYGAAEPFAPCPAAHGVAAGGAGVGEVEVLDYHRGAVVLVAAVEQGGDRRPDSSVPARCGQTRRLDGNRQGNSDGVSRRVEHAAGQVIGVQINSQHRPAAQLLDRRRLGGDVLFPGGVQVPAAFGRVVADVVAHCAAARDALGPLLTAVGEPHRCCDLKVRAELGDQRGGHLDPQLACLIDPDGFVAALLAGLPVGGQEHPGGVPASPPLRFGHRGHIEVMAVAPQAFPTHRDRRVARRQGILGGGQAGPQHRQPAGLRKPFVRRSVPATPTTPTTTIPSTHWCRFPGAQRAALLQHRHSLIQIDHVGGKPAHPQLVLILDRAGDRPRPARRRHRGHCTLALGPQHRTPAPIQPTPMHSFS